MTRRHGDNVLCKAAFHKHGTDCHRLSHRRARTINTKHRYIQIHDAKRSRDQLPEQIPCHDIPDIFRFQSGIADCDVCCHMLHFTLRLFPCFSTKQRIVFYNVIIFSKFSGSLFFSGYGSGSDNARRHFKLHAPLSNHFVHNSSNNRAHPSRLLLQKSGCTYYFYVVCTTAFILFIKNNYFFLLPAFFALAFF